MDTSYSEDFYLSLLEVIQGLCTKFIRFQQFVEIKGTLSVEMDNVKREEYVILELIKASGNTSKSYCSQVSVNPRSRSPVGYSSNCLIQVEKFPQKDVGVSRSPMSKAEATCRRRFPVSLVPPLLNSIPHISCQFPESTQQTASSNIAYCESKRSRLSSRCLSSAKPQPIPNNGTQHASAILTQPILITDDSEPDWCTLAQPVIVTDARKPNANPAALKHPQECSLRHPQEVSHLDPVSTGTRLKVVSSNVAQPLLRYTRLVPASNTRASGVSQIPNAVVHPLTIDLDDNNNTLQLSTTEHPLNSTSIQHPMHLDKQLARDHPQIHRLGSGIEDSINSEGRSVPIQGQFHLQSSTTRRQDSNQLPIPLTQNIGSHCYSTVATTAGVEEDTCGKSSPMILSPQTCKAPLKNITENRVQEVMSQKGHQLLQRSQAGDNDNLVGGNLPIFSKSRMLLEEVVQFKPMDCTQEKYLRPIKLFSKDTDETDSATSDDSDEDSDMIEVDLEEEIYLMEMEEEEEKEKADGLPPVGALASQSASPSTLEKKKTGVVKEWPLTAFIKYHVDQIGKEIDLFSISPTKLNSMLIDFFVGGRTINKQPLSPLSLKAIFRCLSNYLERGGYGYSLLKNVAFKSSKDFLQVLLKDKNMTPADVVNTKEVEILYKGALGARSLVSIRNSMWFMGTIYLGLTKTVQHVKLKWGEILLKTEEDGEEYLMRSTPEQSSSLKVFADAEKGDHCFVHLYKMYRDLRPKATLHDDCAFYLKVNRMCNEYTTAPLKATSMNHLRKLILLKSASSPGKKLA